MKMARILSLCAIGIGAVVLFLTTDRGSAVRNTIADTSGDLMKRLREESGKAMDKAMDKMKGARQQAMDMVS